MQPFVAADQRQRELRVDLVNLPATGSREQRLRDLVNAVLKALPHSTVFVPDRAEPDVVTKLLADELNRHGRPSAFCTYVRKHNFKPEAAATLGAWLDIWFALGARRLTYPPVYIFWFETGDAKPQGWLARLLGASPPSPEHFFAELTCQDNPTGAGVIDLGEMQLLNWLQHVKPWLELHELRQELRIDDQNARIVAQKLRSVIDEHCRAQPGTPGLPMNTLHSLIGACEF